MLCAAERPAPYVRHPRPHLKSDSPCVRPSCAYFFCDADELRAVFPPRSLCAQGGLACALETRQVRLAYYVNELVNTKLPHLSPAMQGAVLQFLEGGFAGATGEGEEEDDDEDEENGVRKSLTALADEEKNMALAGAVAGIEVEGRVARLSPREGAGMKHGAGGLRKAEQAGRPLWAVLDAEGRAAYERLRATLSNGVTVIKVCVCVWSTMMKEHTRPLA